MNNKNTIWTLELTKKYLKNLGYELMNTDYKVKLILKDSEGYYYITKFSRINYSNKLPNKFHPANPYTIQNIDLYLSINYPNLKLIDNYYVNSKTNFTLQSKEGFLYLSSIDKLRYTYPRMVDSRNPFTIQNIKLWCKLNNKPFELLSDDYELDCKKLKWKCLNENCGEEFEAHWNAISQNTGCGYCDGKKVGLSNCLATKNPKIVSEWHPTLNGDLTPYDVTVNSGKYVWWQCLNNPKHIWNVTIDCRSNGNNCPYCNDVLPSEEYNLFIHNPKLCEEWDYTKNKKQPNEYLPNSNEKVWWICKECGYEWVAIINSRNGRRTGCPKCAESKGEKQLDLIFTKYNISHDSQYIFDDLRGVNNGLLRFDVPVFWDKEQTRLRMLVEYDGKQHYEWIKGMMTKKEFETLQIHDERKNQYCKNNNIKLLRIPYWDFNNIEEILKKELNLVILN